MSAESLIAEIYALERRPDGAESAAFMQQRIEWNAGLNAAIEVIRAHAAEPPQDRFADTGKVIKPLNSPETLNEEAFGKAYRAWEESAATEGSAFIAFRKGLKAYVAALPSEIPVVDMVHEGAAE